MLKFKDFNEMNKIWTVTYVYTSDLLVLPTALEW